MRGTVKACSMAVKALAPRSYRAFDLEWVPDGAYSGAMPGPGAVTFACLRWIAPR